MPFRSQAQRRLFYAKAERGEISRDTLHEWEQATADRKLPERATAVRNAALGKRKHRSR